MGSADTSNDAPAPLWLRPPPESMTDGIVTLRRWRVADADGFCHVINSSRAEFVEWFPWAKEHYGRDKWCEFRERKARGWRQGRTWSYALTRADEPDIVLGSCDLGLSQGNQGLNVGYWLATAYLGRGYATRAAAMLTRSALEDMGSPFARIVHDVANERSARIPRRLGYVCEGETQPPPGEENPENRPDVAWIKYAVAEGGAGAQGSESALLSPSREESSCPA